MLTAIEMITAIEDITNRVLIGDIEAEEALEIIGLILHGGGEVTWN